MTAQIDRRSRRSRRWLLLWAQDGICPGCGGYMSPNAAPLSRGFPTLDHITPRAQQGDNRIENLLVKHRRCNERRGDAPAKPRDYQMLAKVQARFAEPGRPTNWIEAKELVMAAHVRRFEKSEIAA